MSSLWSLTRSRILETSPRTPFTSTIVSPAWTWQSACAAFQASTRPPVTASTRNEFLLLCDTSTPSGCGSCSPLSRLTMKLGMLSNSCSIGPASACSTRLKPRSISAASAERPEVPAPMTRPTRFFESVPMPRSSSRLRIARLPALSPASVPSCLRTMQSTAPMALTVSLILSRSGSIEWHREPTTAAPPTDARDSILLTSSTVPTGSARLTPSLPSQAGRRARAKGSSSGSPHGPSTGYCRTDPWRDSSRRLPMMSATDIWPG
mmetsp:Transcript_74979/g.212080  ORF Transcript_74979/g.212080 Transcript_74979/m.212080 type:complete len:264 (+) Transcript_74979:164-955(+)